MRLVAFSCLAISLLGCAHDAKVSARGGGPPVSAAAPSTWETKTTMAGHFLATSAMLDAILLGDLDAFRRAAVIVASDEQHGPPWSRSTDLHDAAVHAQNAKDTRDAAAALAAIGVACGNCHRLNGGPTGPIGSPPAAVATGSLRMARHRWAGERLWQGLVEPADDAWTLGSSVFADAPLVIDAVPSNAPQEKQAAAFALAARAHAIAEEAKLARTTEDRQRLFGELYATCAGCHALKKN